MWKMAGMTSLGKACGHHNTCSLGNQVNVQLLSSALNAISKALTSWKRECLLRFVHFNVVARGDETLR